MIRPDGAGPLRIGPGPLGRARGLLALLLLVSLFLSSVEVLRADADFARADGAASSTAAELSGGAPALPDMDADCACLCSCACTQAQVAVLPVAPVAADPGRGEPTLFAWVQPDPPPAAPRLPFRPPRA